MKRTKDLSKSIPPISHPGRGIPGALAAAAMALVLLLSSGCGNTVVMKRYEIANLNQVDAVLETASGTYYGPIVDEAYSGMGRFQFTDGNRYEGNFANNLRNGEGTFAWKNGDSFSGTWVNDKMLEGKYCFADGTSYSGTFEGDRFVTGTYDYGDACDSLDMDSYTATFAEGKVVSVAFETRKGMKYTGELSGKASIRYENGDSYEGAVTDGIRSGTGEYKWASGGVTQSSYEGEWKDNQMDGKGTYHYSGATYPYITGTFVAGKPEGTAVYYKEAGNTFDTLWKDGVCVSVTES